MFYQLVFFLLFGEVLFVDSLQCKTAWPPDCLFNSTCQYRTKECNGSSSSSSSSNVRGGNYCVTVVKSGEEIVIGNMDCMYDQETSKVCRNQSECRMKYTSKEKKYLHCCCDKDFCNLNFDLSNPTVTDSATISETSIEKTPHETCRSAFCSKKTYLFSLLIVVPVFLLIVCWIKRTTLSKLGKNMSCWIDKKPWDEKRVSIDPDQAPLMLPNANLHSDLVKEIDREDLIVDQNVLKQGRFSRIYLAQFHKDKVAIKVFSSLPSTDPARSLFNHEKEIYSLPAMRHDNFLKFLGQCQIDQQSSLVFEYAEHGSLRDYLRLHLLRDEQQLVCMCQQVSNALEYLHQDFRHKSATEQGKRPPVAHRDLKSENILLHKDNRLVLADFAMSIQLDENRLSSSDQQQIGTARYMAPEILVGTIGNELKALLLCDVYALSLVFWELISRCDQRDPNNPLVMPFEEQLRATGVQKSPSISDMARVMRLDPPSNRPLIKESWRTHTTLNEIIQTIEECWETNPEARINSSVVASRMRKL